ncbi:MAG: 3-phosphoglycerate dehydrogenase [Clostridia bacterium]|nr:3-phosphoglycerate dehydrogenase [Clostridia bacterium]
MKIQLMNKIAACGTKKFDPALYEVGTDLENPDGIMVRSASLLDMEFGENLLGIARAGAGVNNIPIDRCTEKGIVVFNTPGANANAVKELAVAALLLASRNIVGGIAWAQGLKENVAASVEKGKSQFAGHELKGKTLGILGLGAIGGMLANTAVALGMDVIGCDPYLSVSAAMALDPHVRVVESYDALFAQADYLSIHVPAMPTTNGMINAEAISKMKDGVRILNLARDTLVVAKDVKDALASGKVSVYVTDFPTEEVIGVPGIIPIPHLGASTEESEDNCARMAAAQLDDYLRNGNITNSVNYPAVSAEFTDAARLCISHENVPGMLAKITEKVSAAGLNIEHMVDKSKKNQAYLILDFSIVPSDDLVRELGRMENVNRVRLITK